MRRKAPSALLTQAVGSSSVRSGQSMTQWERPGGSTTSKDMLMGRPALFVAWAVVSFSQRRTRTTVSRRTQGGNSEHREGEEVSCSVVMADRRDDRGGRQLGTRGGAGKYIGLDLEIRDSFLFFKKKVGLGIPHDSSRGFEFGAGLSGWI